MTRERAVGFSNVPVPYSWLPQVTGWRGSNDLSPTLAILLNKIIIHIHIISLPPYALRSCFSHIYYASRSKRMEVPFQ